MNLLGILRLFFFLTPIVCLISCSNTSPTSPPNSNSKNHYLAPPSAVDAPADSAMLEQFFDSSYAKPPRMEQGKYVPASLEDSVTRLVQFAISKVTDDSALHIPYVWGGKRLDKEDEWVRPPMHNDTCPARVGLDCSGFIQYIFEQVGFGRHTPEINAEALSDPSNWEFMTKRGYQIRKTALPSVSSLKPGDVLFFKNESGHISHIGLFTGTAQFGKFKGPAFVSSLGHSDCATNYEKEQNGQLSGVRLSPLGSFWGSRLVASLRFYEPDSIGGTISLLVTMNASATQQESGETVTKTETATTEYDLVLPNIPFRSSAMWMVPLTGKMDWTEEIKTTHACGISGSVTDISTGHTTWSQSDSTHDSVSVQLSIEPSGQYRLLVVPWNIPEDARYTFDQTTYCRGEHHTSTSQNTVQYFLQYFTPSFGGMSGYFEGSTSDQFRNSWHGVDTFPLFYQGTNTVTAPVNATVTWNLETK
jgi:cell wall-associated NlpC family hydrolase